MWGRMVLLCGAQGAGKSTFATALLAGAKLRWHRVNQDTIRQRELLAPELSALQLTG